jgi:hypothetical protein
MRAILLLICSNIFMTFAWYGHLKWFPKQTQSISYFPIKIIMISWGIAFFEYCFQVPANKIGLQIEGITLGQLKILQEVITLAVFTVFCLIFMHDKLSWRYYAACVLMLGAVALVFAGKK